MSNFSCVLMGNESLLIQCAEKLIQGGDTIGAVITRSPEIRAWAKGLGIRAEQSDAGLSERLGDLTFDWLFSIANLSVIPQAVLERASRGAINFHDGPLPRHAGLNAPVWAILAGEKQHGVTWHMIEGGIDEGDIVKQQLFEMTPNETALTLNTRCYEAAIDSFADLLSDLHGAGPQRQPQDLSQRTYHARLDRPTAAARLNFNQTAESLAALVRALDHGTYWNPLTCPKVDVGGRVLLVAAAQAESGAGTAAPGQVLEATPAGLVVGTASVPLRLTGLRDVFSGPVCPSTVARPGDRLTILSAEEAKALSDAHAKIVGGEGPWRRYLQSPQSVELPSASTTATGASALRQTHLNAPAGLGGDTLLAAVGAWAARLSGKSTLDLAYQTGHAPRAPGYLSTWVPLRLEAAAEQPFAAFAEQCAKALNEARKHPAFALDLVVRDPAIKGLAVPQIGLSQDV
ncbi:MAG TPA: formyltransferase family protein, partial [Hydrogenophaga sp.]